MELMFRGRLLQISSAPDVSGSTYYFPGCTSDLPGAVLLQIHPDQLLLISQALLQVSQALLQISQVLLLNSQVLLQISQVVLHNS